VLAAGVSTLRHVLAILGAGRNGSTLLMRLLDGSPGLWVFPIELNVLQGRDWLGQPANFEAWARDRIGELETNYLARLVEPFDPGDPLAGLEETRGLPVGDRFAGFLAATRAAYAASRVQPDATLAFKTTEVAAPERWEALLPGLRQLHIVRDPVANYASLKRTDMLVKGKPFWFQEGDTLRAFVELRWSPHVRYALEAIEREPQRHRLVRYEDLCREPGRIVGELCDWLGVSPPAERDLQTVLGGRPMKELPDRTSRGGASAPARVVEGVGVGADAADDVVSARERAWIAFRTGELAGRLGYDLGPAPPRGKLLRSWVLPDRWETMNSRSRMQLGKAILARRAYIARRLVSAP
jgi:hypothetical protein